MNATKHSFIILPFVAALVLTFMLGRTSIAREGPSAPLAMSMAEWVAVQTANSLLLDQGPVSVYLPVLLDS